MKIPRRELWLLVFVLGLTVGCAKISHMQELLTLKAYSDEKVGQAQYVETRDRQFDALVQEVREGTITGYRDRAGIEKKFGSPIVVTPRTAPDKGEVWLYRYQTQWQDARKVFLYFDQAGLLLEGEVREPAGAR